MTFGYENSIPTGRLEYPTDSSVPPSYSSFPSSLLPRQTAVVFALRVRVASSLAAPPRFPPVANGDPRRPSPFGVTSGDPATDRRLLAVAVALQEMNNEESHY